ncbi:hypothetical protein [Streptomyces sp. ACT015]
MTGNHSSSTGAVRRAITATGPAAAAGGPAAGLGAVPLPTA